MSLRVDDTTPGYDPNVGDAPAPDAAADAPKASGSKDKDSVVDASPFDAMAQYAGDWLGDAKQAVEHPIDTATNAINTWAASLDDCTDIDKNIGQLHDGDRCTFKASAELGVGKAVAENERSATVTKKREDGKDVYVVELKADSTLQAKLSEEGPEGSAEVSAGAKFGQTVELRYATAEEAATAVRGFSKQCAADAVQQAFLPGMIGPNFASGIFGPSDEEKAVIARGKIADEIELGGVAKAEATLGPKVEIAHGVEAKLAEAGIHADATVKAKLDYAKNEIVVTKTFKVEGEAAAAIGGGGKHELEIAVTQTYKLPPGETLDANADPIELASEMTPTDDPKLTIKLENELPGRKKLETTLTCAYDANAFAKADVLGNLLDGNVVTAKKQITDTFHGSVKSELYKVDNHAIGPKVEAGGFDAGIGLQSTFERKVER
ncbi:MAG: hypothetical protein JST54_17005 [Deltaproteobacteria bacterium]|nr:hypothetical protein [Deltaproteobacteria bacterium]